MRATRSKTIVLAACLVAAAAAEAAGGPVGRSATTGSPVAARPAGRLLAQLILIVRTAGDPAVARIAYDRAVSVDPTNAQLRLAWSARSGQAVAAAPAAPAARAATARGVSASLAGQSRALAARVRDIQRTRSMLRDTITGRRAAPRPRRTGYRRHVIFGRGLYPYPGPLVWPHATYWHPYPYYSPALSVYGYYVGRHLGIFGSYRTGYGHGSGLHVRIGT